MPTAGSIRIGAAIRRPTAERRWNFKIGRFFGLTVALFLKAIGSQLTPIGVELLAAYFRPIAATPNPLLFTARGSFVNLASVRSVLARCVANQADSAQRYSRVALN